MNAWVSKVYPSFSVTCWNNQVLNPNIPDKDVQPSTHLMLAQTTKCLSSSCNQLLCCSLKFLQLPVSQKETTLNLEQDHFTSHSQNSLIYILGYPIKSRLKIDLHCTLFLFGASNVVFRMYQTKGPVQQWKWGNKQTRYRIISKRSHSPAAMHTVNLEHGFKSESKYVSGYHKINTWNTLCPHYQSPPSQPTFQGGLPNLKLPNIARLRDIGMVHLSSQQRNQGPWVAKPRREWMIGWSE